MTADEITKSVAVSNALISAFHSSGMKLLADGEQAVLAKLQALGVTADVSPSGCLELRQGNTLMVLSQVCETIRQQNPELFVSDPRRDAIVSREDFHGSASEVSHAKSDWIKSHSLEQWERLPATRAEAERKATVPSPTMNRSQYLSLSARERGQLAGLIGADGISKIMARTK